MFQNETNGVLTELFTTGIDRITIRSCRIFLNRKFLVGIIMHNSWALINQVN